jgi:hypothetical protein
MQYINNLNLSIFDSSSKIIMKLHKLLGIVFLLCANYTMNAQVDYDQVKPVSDIYFIDSINVYSHELGIQQNMKILIKDGVIADIGTNINKPFDAIELKGDSMFAYPAFIDGASHAGIKKADDKQKEEKVKFPGKPGDERAGVTPYKSIDGEFIPGDKSLEAYRQAGYGIAHVVPKGKMLPGHGSIVLLKSDGQGNPYLLKDFSQFAQFSSANGVFPSTVIGVISRFKELHRSTSYKLKHLKTYETVPGVARPQFSKAEEAFIPIVENNETVFFLTNNHKDISRAVKLKDELGFNLILTDIQQGWMALDKIRSNNIPTILSLKLPDELKEEKTDSTKKVSEEQLALKDRQKKTYDDYLNQTLAFAKANIPFSFSSMSVKAKDIQKSLQRIKETGVEESTILKALTTNPAKLLGIDKLTGSIEKGKLANLFICTKSFFEKGAKIKWCFVEGEKSEYDVSEKKKKKSAGESMDIAGTWSFESSIMGMEQTGNIIISGNPEAGYEVKVESDQDPGDFEDGQEISFDNNQLSFSMTVDNDGVSLPITFSINFEGESYDGNMNVGNFGSFPVEGSRTRKPE